MPSRARPTSTGSGDYLFEPVGLARTVAIPDTLKMARERRGLTAKELADELGRSRSYVSRAESNADTLPVTGADLDRYAEVLEVPVSLLTRRVHREPPEGTHFRSNRVTLKVRNQLEAEANFAADALNRLIQQSGLEWESPWTLPSFDMDEFHSPEVAAQTLRHQWRLGNGPITDIAGILEATGVFVLPMPAGIKGVDAITVRTPGPVTAIIFLAMDRPTDRIRFTLAHELGHLVMDTRVAVPMDEDEANADRFAGEFLLPFAEIEGHVQGITPGRHMDHLLLLHREWGVHPTTILRSAYTHRSITQQQYRYWYRVLNSMSLVRANLDSAYPVVPNSARDLITELHADKHGVRSIRDMGDQFPRDLARYFGQAWPYGRHLEAV